MHPIEFECATFDTYLLHPFHQLPGLDKRFDSLGDPLVDQLANPGQFVALWLHYLPRARAEAALRPDQPLPGGNDLIRPFHVHRTAQLEFFGFLDQLIHPVDGFADLGHVRYGFQVPIEVGLQLPEVLLEAPQLQALLQPGQVHRPELLEAPFRLLQLHQESVTIATVIKMVMHSIV